MARTGVEIVASCSKADHDFAVKIDDGPWVKQHGRGRYESPLLVDGHHTVTYAAGELELPTLDYLIVKAGPSTPLQDRTIIVDDGSPSLTYAGDWTTDIVHPLANNFSTTAFKSTIHWTKTVGDTLQFNFTGSAIAIFGTFVNHSQTLEQNFSAIYTIDGLSTTRYIPTGSLDGLPMARLFSVDAPDGFHTFAINVTQITPPMAVGFDFLTYNASFANIASVDGHQTPMPASRNMKIPAAAIAATVIGMMALICTTLLVFLIHRKRRRVDDDQSMDKEAWKGKMRMQFWRDAVKGISEGKPPRHPIAIALHEASQRANIPAYHLKRIVDARDAELNTPTHLTSDSLVAHAESTSSTVLYLLLSLLSLPSSALSHAASHLGAAQTITTLLRALPFHAKNGRMIIPAEITAKHGVKQEDVFRYGPNAEGVEDAVFEFATLANDHLLTARDMLKEEGMGGKVPARAMPVFLAGVPISNFLGRLEKVNFDAFTPALQTRDWKLPWQLWRSYYKRQF
ncbi:hypothetical protein DXG03_005003 [Asterophora parasitica]|uniref:Uncharacterized protein n=1 Tax=Asterophora parasitica TaxID=117018 RepID=A0A9P7GD99_9AGAR|nr:hypothetical protein DXG03_005003 [Asterophora parasitica]